jgi:hypothetical protein
MRPEQKKRVFAIFIALVFIGSSLAFAIEFALPMAKQENQELPTVVEMPLNDSAEAPYVQQGFIVVRYFYWADCPDCAKVEDAINGLRDDPGKVLLERIDMDQWPDAATAAGVTTAPAIYLKGASSQLLKGAVSYSDLFNAACPVYFNPPPGC